MHILVKNFISIILVIFLLNNSQATEIQYKFDNISVNYNHTISNQQVGILYWYNHYDIFKNSIPLIADEQFTFKECQTDSESDLIIFIKPNFFYNSMMTILYGKLSITLYSDEKKEYVKTYEDDIKINLLGNYEYFLSQMYKKIFHQIKLDIPKNSHNKTNGILCSLL